MNPDTTPLSRQQFQALRASLDRKARGPLFRQVRDGVRHMIRRGELRPGAAIPPQRELGHLLGLSELTVRRALQELADEGLIIARPRHGTVVAGGEGGEPGAGAAPATMTIGVAFADLTDGYPFFQPVLAGLRAGAEATVAARLFDMAGGAAALHGLDGIIMNSPVNLQLLALCQQRRLPTVLFYTDIADDFSHCIVVDYTRGVLQAVRHLVERGRSRIALVTAGARRFSTGQLADAYRHALEHHGLTGDPAWIIHAGYHERAGFRATQSLLALPTPPDAILFASDYQARGGLLAAQHAGLTPGRDLAIVGAGRILGDDGWPVPLTTIDLRLHDAGRHARHILTDLAAGRTDIPPRTCLPSELVVGQTS